MYGFAEALALACAAGNAVAGAFGLLRWWQVKPSRAFWVLLRVAQLAAVVQAGAAAAFGVAGYTPGDGLYWLYAALPVAVAIVAEQVRALAAQSVLDATGLESAAAVGRLDEAGQRAVVVAILRREMGVMALAALVAAFLAVRAWGTA